VAVGAVPRAGGPGRVGDAGGAGGHVWGRVMAGYRKRCVQPRVRRGALRYTDAEFGLIVAAAAESGMRPGAGAQQAALDMARGRNRPGQQAAPELVHELQELRRVLRNVGGNLNDLARTANATGELPAAQAVGTVLRLVGRVVQTADTVLVRVRAELW
jgi:hypothetical protein